MSRTIKHQTSAIKTKTPKEEKGTKTTLRAKYLKELEEDYDYNLEFMEI